MTTVAVQNQEQRPSFRRRLFVWNPNVIPDFATERLGGKTAFDPAGHIFGGLRLWWARIVAQGKACRWRPRRAESFAVDWKHAIRTHLPRLHLGVDVHLPIVQCRLGDCVDPVLIVGFEVRPAAAVYFVPDNVALSAGAPRKEDPARTSLQGN